MTVPKQGEGVSKELCDERHKNIDERLEAIGKSLDELRALLRGRLPVWATLLISVLMLIIGIMSRFI